MQYFDIPTIKSAIERLQNHSANWLLPAFVFAANDVGTDELVDLSQHLGTDQFLDRYFNGVRLEIPPFPSGNNLLRPRLKGIRWDKGDFAGDYMIRQDTKMWGNLFSSRGYREMRLEGLIEGQKTITGLTDAFQPRFEQEISADFQFEDFLVWLFAFEGFPDSISGWEDLQTHLLSDHLKISQFKPPYQTRFKLSQPAIPWPSTQKQRPTNQEFLDQLAPKLAAYLASKSGTGDSEIETEDDLPPISTDDPVYAEIMKAAKTGESLAFLLAGPPGTGKTRYARRLAAKIADEDSDRILFLQFHPAVGYDDFIEGFRPAASKSQSGVRYELAPRLFLKFAQLATKNPDKLFVAVIDELNRGDVARIFGEALTYLEPDYRDKKFTLSFSGKSGVIPKNLIVLATANPFDRSVTDLDDALLRRFWVIDLEPDSAVLENHLSTVSVDENVIRRTIHLFNLVNEAMPHGFGHTSFLRVRSVDDLAAVWMGRVRPTLRRALMHDPESFNSSVAEIEALLTTSEDENMDEEATSTADAEENG